MLDAIIWLPDSVNEEPGHFSQTEKKKRKAIRVS